MAERDPSQQGLPFTDQAATERMLAMLVGFRAPGVKLVMQHWTASDFLRRNPRLVPEVLEELLAELRVEADQTLNRPSPIRTWIGALYDRAAKQADERRARLDRDKHRAARAFAEGCADWEVAKLLGATITRIADWRKRWESRRAGGAG